MTSYTKGPWRAEGFNVIAKHYGCIARSLVRSLTVYMSKGEREANANLMACAPELVDALQALVDKHKQQGGSWDDELVKAQQLLKRVRGEE